MCFQNKWWILFYQTNVKINWEMAEQKDSKFIITGGIFCECDRYYLCNLILKAG